MRAVRWREGMFLRPQHFQQHDLFLESRQIAYHEAALSEGWGVVRLELQNEALDNFVLDARSIRAVLPDGVLVDVPGNARLPGRTLDSKGMKVGDPLTVSIGVRRREERRAGTLSEGAGRGETRFLAVEEESYDSDTGREPVPLEKLEYDLQFFLGDEKTTGYEVLPVASLSLTGANAAHPVGMTHGFAPPSLVLSASPTLRDAARGVVERIATVLRETQDTRGTEKVRELILYQALAGYLPVLRDMVAAGNVHPRQVYVEMARLAGTLFYRDTHGRSFDEIPGYDHANPGPVFTKLRDLIVLLSEPLFTKRFKHFPMERSGDLFRVGLPVEAKAPGVRYLLELHADESQPRLGLLMKTGRISSGGRIEHLSKYALPGIATDPMSGPPSELPPGQTGTYFRLKVEDGTEWPNQVVPAGELCVYLLGAPGDVRVNLLLIFPEEK